MPKIAVVGSSNTDMVVKTTRFPGPGETIIGGDFFMFPGGKGANQAVAAARLGANVSFISCVGDDIFGQQAVNGFIKEGIEVSGIKTIPNTASGVALITVNAEGENEIVVASGANALLNTDHLLSLADKLKEQEIILTQLETPVEAVAYLADFCRKNKKKLIINPAPAAFLPNEVFQDLFLITPNETEAGILTGIEVLDLETARRAAFILIEKGIQHVIITLGSKGAVYFDSEKEIFVPAEKVQAVDTTAAGDVFNGALALKIAEVFDWESAIKFANKAAALSVTKMGAQASAPYLNELN